MAELPLGRRLKKASVRLAAIIVPFLYLGYMRLVVATSRVDRTELDGLFRRSTDGEDLAMAILHQDIFAALFFFGGQRVQTVASVGDAGTVISALLARVGLVTQRGGSSSRASRRVPVLNRMITHAREHRSSGLITAFTTDGSRGPAGVCRLGVAQFASTTGVSVYCVRVHGNRALHLNTWDRSMVPLPFGELRFEVTGPFPVAERAEPAEVERCRAEVEAELHELHRRSFERYGKTPVPALSQLKSPVPELVRLEEL